MGSANSARGMHREVHSLHKSQRQLPCSCPRQLGLLSTFLPREVFSDPAPSRAPPRIRAMPLPLYSQRYPERGLRSLDMEASLASSADQSALSWHPTSKCRQVGSRHLQ